MEESKGATSPPPFEGEREDGSPAPPSPVAFKHEAGKPRLIVVKMVLENFKSYGGVREIGPFHKCFSAIVGPNGSGKSNVIDALLFVFGKRAKQLRLKKVSELIHRSSSKPNLTYAKVSVHFREVIDTDDSDDGFTVVPGSELVISRVAKKDNSSKYYLNGKGSSFGGVAEVLRSKGVDLDNNRFLILQGEVEQIAMMKPKALTPHDMGLLEYLEDIIGSNRFVESIEAAAGLLEGLNDERASVLNRVRLAEKEKTALEGSKAEAERYTAAEREIAVLNATLAQKSAYNARQLLDKEAQRAEVLNARRQEVKQELDEQAEGMTAMEKKHKQLAKDLETVRNEQITCKEEFTAFERKDIKSRADIKHEKSAIKKAKAAVARETKKAAAAQKSVEDAEASIPELLAAVEAAEADKARHEAKVDEILESVKGEAEQFRVAMEAKQQELEPWSAKLNDAKAELDTATTEHQLLKERLEAGEKELAKLRSAAAETEEKLVANKDTVRRLGHEHQTKSARLEQVVDDLANAQRKQAAYGDKVKELRAVTAESKMAMQQETSRGRLVTELNRATRRGGALADAGLCGRLGDLGTIDPEFDVAISTACGALNHMVVETVAGAQRCVRFLRDNNLGVATFIILEKIQALRKHMDREVNIPKGTQRLFDLVKMSDDKYAVAFYYGLRNTLVAKDLEQATAVAYHGNKCMWRVVTKTGELIDTSGTMSGGGGRVRRGAMKAAAPTVTPEEMEAAEQDLARYQNQLLDCRNMVSLLTSEKRGLEKALPALKVRLSKAEMEVTSLTARLEELRSREAVLEGQVGVSDADAAELGALAKAVSSLSRKYNKVKVVTDRLEGEIDALQKRIMDVGGTRLKKQKGLADAAIASLEAATRAVTKARVDIKAGTKAKAKAEAATRKAEADLAKAEARFEKLTAAFKQIQDDAFQVMTAYKEAEQLVAAKEKELAGVKKEFEALTKAVDKIRAKDVDVSNELQDCKRGMAKYESQIAASEAAFAKQQETYASFLPLDDGADDVPAAKATTEAGSGSGSGSGSGDDSGAGAGAGSGDEEEDEDMSTAAKIPRDIPRLGDDRLEGLNVKDVQRELKLQEAQRDDLKANVNMGAIQEFKRKEREWLARVADLDAITDKRDKCRRGYEKLRKQRLDAFMAGFSVITRKLKEMYQMITLGGDAELELVERLDPFSEGIVFSVRPPNKSWKNISNLSGGEKTLSSLALVFALHHYRPTPLYVMDEIDAALDFKNVSIIAHYIKERTKNAQFVIISLRNNMFEIADRLVGIYKTNDITKSVTINPKTFQNATATQAKVSAPREAGPALGDRTNTVA